MVGHGYNISGMEFVRLFTAIVPDASTQTEIASSLARGPAAASLRPVKPQNIHCTLQFLGNTDPSSIPTIVDAIEQGVSSRPGPLSLSVGLFGTFPSARKARVVFRSVGEPSGHLRDLQKAVASAMVERGIRFDDRPFRPHVTVAYVKRRERPGPGLVEELNAGIDGIDLVFEIDRIHLIRSETGPGGSVYTSVHSVPLSPASDAISSGESARE